MLLAVWLAAVSLDCVAAHTYHVNVKTGDDVNDGLAKETAFASVGRAALAVSPGDTVLVAPGVYFEIPQLLRSGTEKAPITLKASPDGEVIITNAVRSIREGQAQWQVAEAAKNIHVTSATHEPVRVLCDGLDRFPYRTLEDLKNRGPVDPRKKLQGPPEGFCWADGQLFVRLAKGHTPSQSRLAVCGAPTYSDGPITTNIRLANVSHVILDGFHFEVGGQSGVLLYMCEHVTVRNCLFTGVVQAVDVQKAAGNILVEHNEFHCEPMFELSERPDLYTWAWKSYPKYRYETGFVDCAMTDSIIRYNYVHDMFDGIRTSPGRNPQVYGNIFARCVDNAVETEWHSRNLHLHRNLFLDCFQTLSFQPLWEDAGPVYVYDNLSIQRKRRYFPRYEPIWLKISTSYPGGEGVHIYNNTVIQECGGLMACYSHPKIRRLSRRNDLPEKLGAVNFHLYDNVLVMPGDGKAGLFAAHNETRGNVAVGVSAELAGKDGLVLAAQEDVKFRDPARLDFSLSPESPAARAKLGRIVGVGRDGKPWQIPPAGRGKGIDLQVLLGDTNAGD